MGVNDLLTIYFSRCIREACVIGLLKRCRVWVVKLQLMHWWNPTSVYEKQQPMQVLGQAIRLLGPSSTEMCILPKGAVHILRNAKRGEVGQLERYQCVFHLYKLIHYIGGEGDQKLPILVYSPINLVYWSYPGVTYQSFYIPHNMCHVRHHCQPLPLYSLVSFIHFKR